MSSDLSSQVAIVTGAGAGLGRAHALALATHGARVLVNDLNEEAAKSVAAQIIQGGGDAIISCADVARFEQVQAMADAANKRWGRIDILVNNAGILRDRTFAKMELDDFRRVIDVHLMGAVHCTKAVWEGMRTRNYGRILFTTSSSGLYGNFGQSNYGAAKMALVGLMQTLSLEGERHNIRVNCLAPSAATAMTDGLYPKEALAGLGPELVSPAVVALSSPAAPTRKVVLAGAGCFEQANITMTRGIYIGGGAQAANELIERLDELAFRDGEMVPNHGGCQYQYEVERALAVTTTTTGRV